MDSDATFVAAAEMVRSPLLGCRPVRLSTGEFLDQEHRRLPPGSSPSMHGRFLPPWLNADGPTVRLELEALADAVQPLGDLLDSDAAFSEPFAGPDALLADFDRRWGPPSPKWPTRPSVVAHVDSDDLEIIACSEGFAVGGHDHIVCMFKLLTPEWRSYVAEQVAAYRKRAIELGAWYDPPHIHAIMANLRMTRTTAGR